MLSNIREIQARGARPSSSPRRATRRWRRTPTTWSRSPRAKALPAAGHHRSAAGILAAEIAQAQGYDVDKPRNLAKSVTVE